jgi:hypothetical protein
VEYACQARFSGLSTQGDPAVFGKGVGAAQDSGTGVVQAPYGVEVILHAVVSEGLNYQYTALFPNGLSCVPGRAYRVS